jgi:hypothetical protein
METFIDISFSANGEKASKIFSILNDMGLKYHIGDHDFSYDWKRVASIEEELEFIDNLQEKLKGTGAILKITSKR